MAKLKILITAATGKTGFQTALQLLKAGFPVRAFVRRTDHRSETLQRRGAETLVAFLENITVVRQALENVFFQLSDIDTVIVNPSWFADNYMAAMAPLAQMGMMPMPLAGGMFA